MFAKAMSFRTWLRISMKGRFAVIGRYEMPLATTPSSIVDADRHGTQSEFHVLADGISDGIRKRTITSLPEGSASILSGMMLGPTIHYILGLRAEASCKVPPNQPGEDRA
ncbi:hypothetical protein BSR47_01105 [Bradyrhizobium canariense]|nr:hypothetical protein BSR47_01105 [Bradyrhizobium canariense]